ncbi:DNA-binding response regulator [Paenibacillus sp. FSL A5-0031]|uniref:response regulator transcription factor n=1 Tax=Paenibacillus sp. FSL A5-0031 TaxID=1920420 RepID=UPI00096EDD74|nr:response regulator transcription factor [Paenibacillus sp. FSL A5-0031]OME75957.1 DNA-binding response regulator [Paenibacillus sp. FSL A5-0031]
MSDERKHILVIDGDKRSRSLIRMYLEKERCIVEEAEDGETGLPLVIQKNFDLVILELTLSGISGIEVCSLLRQIKSTPVIMLTAEGDEENRLKGFQVGVDDYILKPYSPREMTHRVKALLRRAASNSYLSIEKKTNNLVLPHLVIEWDAHRIRAAGQEVYLTRKEYDLLYYLASRSDKIFSRDELIKVIWNNEKGIDARTVDMNIKRIRDKLNKVSPEAASMIKTIWGVGYILKFSS